MSLSVACAAGSHCMTEDRPAACTERTAIMLSNRPTDNADPIASASFLLHDDEQLLADWDEINGSAAHDTDAAELMGGFGVGMFLDDSSYGSGSDDLSDLDGGDSPGSAHSSDYGFDGSCAPTGYSDEEQDLAAGSWGLPQWLVGGEDTGFESDSSGDFSVQTDVMVASPQRDFDELQEHLATTDELLPPPPPELQACAPASVVPSCTSALAVPVAPPDQLFVDGPHACFNQFIPFQREAPYRLRQCYRRTAGDVYCYAVWAARGCAAEICALNLDGSPAAGAPPGLELRFLGTHWPAMQVCDVSPTAPGRWVIRSTYEVEPEPGVEEDGKDEAPSTHDWLFFCIAGWEKNSTGRLGCRLVSQEWRDRVPVVGCGTMTTAGGTKVQACPICLRAATKILPRHVHAYADVKRMKWCPDCQDCYAKHSQSSPSVDGLGTTCDCTICVRAGMFVQPPAGAAGTCAAPKRKSNGKKARKKAGAGLGRKRSRAKAAPKDDPASKKVKKGMLSVGAAVLGVACLVSMSIMGIFRPDGPLGHGASPSLRLDGFSAAVTDIFVGSKPMPCIPPTVSVNSGSPDARMWLFSGSEPVILNPYSESVQSTVSVTNPCARMWRQGLPSNESKLSQFAPTWHETQGYPSARVNEILSMQTSVHAETSVYSCNYEQANFATAGDHALNLDEPYNAVTECVDRLCGTQAATRWTCQNFGDWTGVGNAEACGPLGCAPFGCGIRCRDGNEALFTKISALLCATGSGGNTELNGIIDEVKRQWPVKRYGSAVWWPADSQAGDWETPGQGGFMYVFGGSRVEQYGLHLAEGDSANTLSDMWVYSTDDNVWETVIPVQLRGSAAFGDESFFDDAVWELLITATAWPVRRFNVAAAWVDPTAGMCLTGGSTWGEPGASRFGDAPNQWFLSDSWCFQGNLGDGMLENVGGRIDPHKPVPAVMARVNFMTHRFLSWIQAVAVPLNPKAFLREPQSSVRENDAKRHDVFASLPIGFQWVVDGQQTKAKDDGLPTLGPNGLPTLGPKRLLRQLEEEEEEIGRSTANDRLPPMSDADRQLIDDLINPYDHGRLVVPRTLYAAGEYGLRCDTSTSVLDTTASLAALPPQEPAVLSASDTDPAHPGGRTLSGSWFVRGERLSTGSSKLWLFGGTGVVRAKGSGEVVVRELSDLWLGQRGPFQPRHRGSGGKLTHDAIGLNSPMSWRLISEYTPGTSPPPQPLPQTWMSPSEPNSGWMLPAPLGRGVPRAPHSPPSVDDLWHLDLDAGGWSQASLIGPHAQHGMAWHQPAGLGRPVSTNLMPPMKQSLAQLQHGTPGMPAFCTSDLQPRGVDLPFTLEGDRCTWDCWGLSVEQTLR